MPWSKNRPNGGKVAAKYRTKQHRDDVARHRAALKAAGIGTCAEKVCVMPTRLITPAMRLHLCHDRSTGQVLGLGHARCNVREASRYARALQGPRERGYTRSGWS